MISWKRRKNKKQYLNIINIDIMEIPPIHPSCIFMRV